MKVLFAASEVAPFAKTGGLADVVGALPRALTRLGHECAVLMPLYRCARSAPQRLEPTGIKLDVPLGSLKVASRLWRSRLPKSDVPVYLVEQPEFFERDDAEQGRGLYQYRLPNGRLKDYPDNCQRFVFFSRAVMEAIPLLGWQPDIIHGHDWQTGLLPVYLREVYRKKPPFADMRSLFTIHNLAYQGIFWHWDMPLTGLDWSLFNYRQLEFYGHLNLLKAGIVFAHAINTVSPRYAEEIQTREHGCALDGVVRQYKDKLTGIINGIDYEDWNPATDPHIAARYDANTVGGLSEAGSSGKAACKQALQERLKLPEKANVPLLAMVSRLAEQKGLKLLHDAADELFKDNVQLAVLGVGDQAFHVFLENLRRRYPHKVAAVFEFNEPLAHQIEAGADIFLMPSRFEPSGLNQLYSLKYGTIPVGRDTGGLHDTITDYSPGSTEATGFLFKEYTPQAFLKAVRRAVATYRDEPAEWLKIRQTGMRQDWSWDHSAAAYAQLYKQLK